VLGLLLSELALPLDLRHADEILPDQKDQRRKNDGEQRVLLIEHLFTFARAGRPARACRFIAATGNWLRRCAVEPRLLAAGGPHATQRALKIIHQTVERQVNGGTTCDHHVIVSDRHFIRVRTPHHIAQAAPQPIALYGIADLAGRGKSEARGSVIAALPRLENEAIGGCPQALGRSQEVRPLPQPVHRNSAG
jgi:hypothetical protein